MPFILLKSQIKVALFYCIGTIFLLHTEEETGKIQNKIVELILLKFKQSGNFKIGKIPLHGFFFNFAHAFGFAVE